MEIHARPECKLLLTYSPILFILLNIMGRKAITLLPSVRRSLSMVGENIRQARLRRGLAAGLVAQRAGIARPTLYAIEPGDPAVAAGPLAMAPWVGRTEDH